MAAFHRPRTLCEVPKVGRLPVITGVIVLSATLYALAALVFVWIALGPRNVLGAFLLNLLPLSWPPCIKGVLPLRLSESYYRIRPFEKDGRSYELLGIRWFQKLMLAPGFRSCNRDIPRSIRNKDLAGLEREMRFAETAHVLTFFLVLSMTIFVLVNGWWDGVAYLVAWNILLNVYPVMLQRFNRQRLGRAMRLLPRRTRSPQSANSRMHRAGCPSHNRIR